MIEIILAFTVACLIGLLFYEKYTHNLERKELVNAIIAKTPEQLRDLKMADKVKPIQPEKIQREFIPEQDLSDEEFKKHIEREIG